MNRLDIRASLRNTADRIDRGEETGLVNGIQGLLREADQYIEDQDKQLTGEVKRARLFDEALQISKAEVARLRDELDDCKLYKILYREIINHLLENA